MGQIDPCGNSSVLINQHHEESRIEVCCFVIMLCHGIILTTRIIATKCVEIATTLTTLRYITVNNYKLIITIITNILFEQHTFD